MDLLTTVVVIAAIVGPPAALAGHGSLAVYAIRKAHRQAKADYTAKIDESREQVKRDMTEIIEGKFRVLNERVEQLKPPTKEQVAEAVRSEIPPAPVIPRIPTTDEIVAAVRAAIPIPAVADELEAFLRSSNGIQWARELAAVISEIATEKFEKKVQGAAGGALKADQARIADVLRGLRFGHIWLDGIWAMAMGDPEIVKLISSGLSKALASAGGSSRVLANEQLALADGADAADEYV